MAYYAGKINYISIFFVVMVSFFVPVTQALEIVPYGVGTWHAETLGNHRAVAHVSDKVDAVWLRIPWRRRDIRPQDKNIILVDVATGKQINNVVRIDINRHFGDIVFQPITVPGDVYIYYMPYRYIGPWYFPNTAYQKPVETFTAEWLDKNRLRKLQLTKGKWKLLPQARVEQIQASCEFNRFDPMEIVATSDECNLMLQQYPQSTYLIFPENRKHPIRMIDNVPLRWVQSGPANYFHGIALRGEYYPFQLGIFAARKSLENVQISYSNLSDSAGDNIMATAFRCFNLGGIDCHGQPFSKTVNIPQGKVQALWLGIQIPEKVNPGTYQGMITVKPQNAPATPVKIVLNILSEVLKDAGDSALWRLARLRWLDSTIGLDDKVFGQYSPIDLEDNTVSILGRKVKFDSTGLPAQIISTFPDTVDGANARSVFILARPLRLVVETSADIISWRSTRPKLTKRTSGVVELQFDSRGGDFSLRCNAKVECDGYIDYTLKLKAQRDVNVKDIRLELPYRRKIAKYMMGLGRKGGYRPRQWQWKWSIESSNSIFWLGDVNAGLQCRLKGYKDVWELFNYKASGIPEDWYNNGKGGCTISEEYPEELLVRAYSGPRQIKKGDELKFRFALLVTPLKVLDKDHWHWRYWHAYTPIEQVIKNSANIINVHHANELNPFINYPFLTTKKLKAYVDKAHEHGIKVKLYYTIRELSNHAAELWPLRSLNGEILRLGRGFRLADAFAKKTAYTGDTSTGYSWLCEHLVTDYVPAWHTHFAEDNWDGALAETGLSRWDNYYLEGMGWLIKNIGIDGLYLDGIGYDREVMKRLRKVMDQSRPGCLIDFHCGNHFSKPYGMNNIANFFMDHFPFIDSLWLGEGFNYNESADYWLVELSGIPYGLFGEMLGKGNPWRGMIYGMTTRLPYGGGDPRAIWQVWDEFGIQDAKMIGYWSKKCPVRINKDDILATVYVKKEQTLLALASWAPKALTCQLHIDWKALQLDPAKAYLYAPPIKNFQISHTFKPEEPITITPAKGWLLLLQEQ